MPDALRHWGRRALPSLPPLSRRARLGLLVIVAAGAILRVLWALKAQQPVELRDPVLYLILAEHVAAGDGYRYGFEADQGVTAYYPPGYPVALGAVLWLVRLLPGDVTAFDVAIWFNVALSVATIGLVFVLGRRLAGDRVGLVAAAIWALWPNLVFHSGVVLTETRPTERRTSTAGTPFSWVLWTRATRAATPFACWVIGPTHPSSRVSWKSSSQRVKWAVVKGSRAWTRRWAWRGLPS